MKNDDRFTVIVVDGESAELGNFDTLSVRYDDLTWEQSVELAKLSFTQGFEIVLWKIDGNV